MFGVVRQNVIKFSALFLENDIQYIKNFHFKHCIIFINKSVKKTSFMNYVNYILFSIIGWKDEDNLSNHDILCCTGKHKPSSFGWSDHF